MSVFLDDTDTSIIYSKGQWNKFGTPYEYDLSTHGTTSAGATAQIPFSGTYIKVYGTITAQSSPDPISSYSIDNVAEGTFSPDSSTITTNAYKQLFFQSGTLAAANHTLIIKSLVAGAHFYFDYVEFTPTTATAAATGTTITTSTGGGGTGSSGGDSRDSVTNKATTSTSFKSTTLSAGTTAHSQAIATHALAGSSSSTASSTQGSLDPSNSSTATSPSNAIQTVVLSTSSKAPIGAIVGGILGAVCFMAAALLLYRYMMKRQRHPGELVLSTAEACSFPSSRLGSMMATPISPTIIPYVPPSTTSVAGSTTARGSQKSAPSIYDEVQPPAYHQAVYQNDHSTSSADDYRA
ncbi:hypothetical protein C8J56DRAFT_1172545 [Mycena floridula]|nr:hypothetical protein C8J56DRAFT_1172545 [Mycena floridula]